MKRFNRTLAALLALLVLAAALPFALSEDIPLDVAPEVEAVEEAELLPEALELDLDEAAEPLGEASLADLAGVEEEPEQEPDRDAATSDVPAAGNSYTDGDYDHYAFRIDYNGVLTEYRGYGKKVVIPDGVTAIGKEAFYMCHSLTSVTIPDSVTSIEDCAFAHCDNLKNVIILSKSISVDYYAFYDSDPTFHTVPGCNYYGEEDVLLLTGSITKKVAMGDTWIICLKGATAKSYTSSDTTVATVTKAGHVKVIKAGTAKITVTLASGMKYVLTLNASDKAKLSKEKLSVQVGKSSKLTVSNLYGRTVTWSSNKPGIATVEDGWVEGVKAGKCTITAKVKNGKTFKCIVTVTDKAKLSKEKLSVDVGKSSKLTVSKLYGRTVTWSTNKPAIATVKDGKVTGVKAGKCTITAKVKNGKTYKCIVTVTDPAELSQTKMALKAGDTGELKVTGLNGRTVTWSSNKPKIATVENGVVTAKNMGKCTVTAKVANGKTLKCVVTVTPKLSSDKLTISTIDTATIELAGAEGKKVTWTTSKKAVAAIVKGDSGSVTIKAGKKGTATIKAKIAGGKTLKCTVKVVDPLEISVYDLDEQSVYNELTLIFTNHSNKKVTYVKFEVLQYNNRGDKLKSPYDSYYLNETVKAHGTRYQSYWVHDDTKKVKIRITEVTFSDRTRWTP